MWQLTFHQGKLLEPTIEDWRSVKYDLILLLYGHSARVWDVALAATYFASVGEVSFFFKIHACLINFLLMGFQICHLQLTTACG